MLGVVQGVHAVRSTNQNNGRRKTNNWTTKADTWGDKKGERKRKREGGEEGRIEMVRGEHSILGNEKWNKRESIEAAMVTSGCLGQTCWPAKRMDLYFLRRRIYKSFLNPSLSVCLSLTFRFSLPPSMFPLLLLFKIRHVAQPHFLRTVVFLSETFSCPRCHVRLGFTLLLAIWWMLHREIIDFA